MSTFGDRTYSVPVSCLSQEIYSICKFPYTRTCIKEQCQQQEVWLFFGDCWFDPKYTEKGLQANLIYVNCISELRLPFVKTVSLLFLGLVTSLHGIQFHLYLTPISMANVSDSQCVVKLKGRTYRLLSLMSQLGFVIQRDNE